MSFGKCLERHIRRGTRPPSDKYSGVRWKLGDLAAQLGVDVKTLYGWRKDRETPVDIRPILRVLCGDGNQAAQKELLGAWRSARGGVGEEQSSEPRAGIPDPGLFIGRDAEVAQLAEAVTSSGGSNAALVLGGPGFGKTVLTQAVAKHEKVVAHFGRRRWFIELATANSAAEVLTRLGNAIGVPPQEGLAAVLARLGSAPALLILDNLETPWWKDGKAVQDLLRAIVAAPKIGLLASARGDEPIDGPAWQRQMWVQPLPEPTARTLLLSVAGRIAEDDPDLPFFVAEGVGVLGGIPLAICLMAIAAGRDGNLSGLRRQWKKVGVALAKRLGGEEHRLDSVVHSIAVSVESPRLKDQGRRLFGLLGQVPAGFAEEDGEALLDGDWGTAVAQLRAVGLLANRTRIDLLPPVRDYAQRFCPPTEVEAANCQRRYIALVESEGCRVGEAGGAEALARLTPELPNIESSIDAANGAADIGDVAGIAGGFADTIRFGGIGDSGVLARLARARELRQDAAGAAAVWYYAGLVLVNRSDYVGATQRYETALPLFRRVGNALGEANCLQSLGDIAESRSDYGSARSIGAEALALYCKIENVLGEANCIKLLARVARAQENGKEARELYNRALQLYEQIDAAVGQANCALALGEIDFDLGDDAGAQSFFLKALSWYRSAGDMRGEANCYCNLGDCVAEGGDHLRARKYVDQALTLYRSAGDTGGEASCLQVLGEISAIEGNHDEAFSQLAAARALYREVGNTHGETNCVKDLGDIARARGDLASAKDAYESALQMYTTKYDIGATHFLLADITKGEARANHLACARKAWAVIDRPDLIEKLDTLGEPIRQGEAGK